MNSLQQFITNFTHDGVIVFKNAEILGRAVKCAANLSNDSQCRESVLKTGVAISIVKILEHANDLLDNETTPESQDSFLDKSSNSNLICSCVRAIRIMASDSKFTCSGRDHLLKFGGLVAVINVLTWGVKLSSNEDLMLDVVRAVTLLSVKIRGAPAEVISKVFWFISVQTNKKLICVELVFC